MSRFLYLKDKESANAAAKLHFAFSSMNWDMRSSSLVPSSPSYFTSSCMTLQIEHYNNRNG